MLMNIFRSSVCVMLMSFFHLCTASESHLAESEHSEGGSTPSQSRARFAASSSDDEIDESHDGTATEVAQSALQNNTFASRIIPTSPPPSTLKAAAKDQNEEEFISVSPQVLVPPTIHINGGMFEDLIIPRSTMWYTKITVSNCTCFNPLDPTTFQNNPALTHISLSSSQLNLRQFEEKFGEGCGNLTCIDLQDFSDVSVTEQPLMTPERFAQIAHPCLLQRVLSENCVVLISHPERPVEPYKLDEMKERFLSSILQLRSLTKAKETISAYQSLIELLTNGVSKLDPTQLAAAGGRVLLSVYTGM
jgi:hypothetical protein